MQRPSISKRRLLYATDAGLKRLYNRLNALWFSDKLPRDMIVKWAPKSMSAMATYSDSHEPPEIEVDRALITLPRVIEWVLLHEMAHARVGISEAAHHGPLWKAEIKRLVRKGAYAGLF